MERRIVVAAAGVAVEAELNATTGETPGPADNDAEEVENHFPNVEEVENHFPNVYVFVQDFLIKVHARPVRDQLSWRWCSQWWDHSEAVSRLEALWKAFEVLRRDPCTGAATWWRDYADPTVEKHSADESDEGARAQTTEPTAKPLDAAAIVRQNIQGLDPAQLMRTYLKFCQEPAAALRAASRPLVVERGYAPGASHALSGVLHDVGLDVPDDVDLADAGSLSSSAQDGEDIWDMLKAAAPEVAESVDRHSAELVTPFLSRKAVRNALAALVWSTVVGLYVAGATLPPPFGPLLSIASSTLGISGSSAERAINRKLDETTDDD